MTSTSTDLSEVRTGSRRGKWQAGKGLQVRHVASDVGRVSKLQSRCEHETVEAIGRQLLDKQVQPRLWQLRCDSECGCASPKLFGSTQLGKGSSGLI